MRVPIPFGKGTLNVSIPDERMGQLLRPRSMPALPDVGDSLRAAMGSEYCEFFLSGLERKARRRDKPTAAILVNDYTRPTPLRGVLPPLLDILNARGVDDSRIRVVIALGTHRRMSEDEFRRQAGEQVLKRVGFINPDIDDTDKLRYIGRDSTLGAIWVNREYGEADIKIAVGTVLPHGAVGFSGGAKLIVPGIAGRNIIEHFHVMANMDPQNRAGWLDSPIRTVIEEVAELVGLELMINLVVDPDGEVCGLTAGHYIVSHREAVSQAAQVYGLPLSRPSSVLVAGSAPADLDFWQAAKAIFNCQAAVEDGGWLVLVTPCPEGIPAEHKAFDRAIGLLPEQIDRLLFLRPHRTPGEVSAEVDPDMDRITLAPALALSRFRRRIRVAVVSPGLTEAQVRRMGLDYFSTVEEALESILQGLPEAKRRVDVVTHGGSTYPYLDGRAERSR